MNFLEYKGRPILEKWWGIVPVFFYIITFFIGSIWTIMGIIDFPLKIDSLPDFLKTRPFILFILSLPISIICTLILDLHMKWSKSKVEKSEKSFIKSFPRSQHPLFFSEVESMLPSAKKMIFIATGLNLIWEKNIVDILIKRAQDKQVSITICLANPLSPHIEDRLIEEQMHNEPIPINLETNLKALVQKIINAGSPANFQVRLFNNYPTFATLIFDNEIYTYPYAYQKVGMDSPIFHFKNDGSPVSNFYISNAERVVRDSISASEFISSRGDRSFFSENWIAAAVYIIPSEHSQFYKFGSEIIGFDIRNNILIKNNTFKILNLESSIGEAQSYGFHATLSDALFFASQSDIDRVTAEIASLAENIKPFNLSEFKLNEKFREAGDIVITCSDLTGTTEILHHELINRVYKMSISSVYLSNATTKSKTLIKDERTNLMLKHFGAPYILGEFKLHFTLCSNTPTNETKRIELFNKLQYFFNKNVSTNSISVNDICLLTKRKGDQRWKIERCFPLTGK